MVFIKISVWISEGAAPLPPRLFLHDEKVLKMPVSRADAPIILQNHFVSLQSKTPISGGKKERYGPRFEMREGWNECNQKPTLTESLPAKYSSLFLHSAQSFNQTASTITNLHVAPNKTQLMSIKKKEGRGSIRGLNTIRWQTCPLVKNGSALELAWTIDEVHMVRRGLVLWSRPTMSDELNCCCCCTSSND